MKMLNEILAVKYPMIQGAMARITNGSFAAACSNAGILGTIAGGGMTMQELEKEIRSCREKTIHPFAVNITMDHPELERIEDLILSMEVPVVIAGNGNALKLIKKVKEKDSRRVVIPILGSPEFALFYQRAGADALIAEGCESGGHIGRMTTMTLVPQVCDAVTIPVVAAGGIADHRQFLAAKALGACGVQVGTALLASVECPVHENYKSALIKAKSSASVVTGRICGDEVRVLKNRLASRYFELEREGDLEGIQKLLEGSYYNAVVHGETENGSLMAGQDCGQITEIKPLAEMIKEICYGQSK